MQRNTGVKGTSKPASSSGVPTAACLHCPSALKQGYTSQMVTNRFRAFFKHNCVPLEKNAAVWKETTVVLQIADLRYKDPNNGKSTYLKKTRMHLIPIIRHKWCIWCFVALHFNKCKHFTFYYSSKWGSFCWIQNWQIIISDCHSPNWRYISPVSILFIFAAPLLSTKVTFSVSL